MAKSIYDLIIIGAGAAGFGAGLYASRYNLKTLILGQIPGGTVGIAHEIQNYLGFEKISGMDLMIKMLEQVKKNGAEFKQEVVKDIKKGKTFTIITNKKNYETKKILLATGSERKKLGIKNEEKFVGRGISYCATCDAGFYKDKITGVVGGGDAALTAALLLAKFSKKVYIFYRGENFVKPEQVWVDAIKKEKKIQPIFKAEVKNLIAKDKISGVELLVNGKIKKIELDGLFIEIGNIPNTELAQKLGVKIVNGEIIIDNNSKTNVPGVYAAGDVTNNPFNQIITAASEGSVAASTAYKELQSEK